MYNTGSVVSNLLDRLRGSTNIPYSCVSPQHRVQSPLKLHFVFSCFDFSLFQFEMECLASCMNPGVCPACANSTYGSIESSRQDAFELSLHRPSLRLDLPAVVTGAVVCYSPTEPHSSGLRLVLPRGAIGTNQPLTFAAAGKGR